ncbi:DUF1902 domain-containing protein [Parasulfuritortus cantonensis]|nr:DUF1902 domain-containing protein [Parasulfuritortus cantonensis]
MFKRLADSILCMFHIQARWDPDVHVWVAESDDLPGLCTESPSLEDLHAKLKVLVPELIELNHVAVEGLVANYQLIVDDQIALAA